MLIALAAPLMLTSLVGKRQDNFPDVPANHWAYEALSVESLAWFSLMATKEARIEDAYKWIYQASEGAEHAIRSKEEVRGWLDGEWAKLKAPERGEPMIVYLRGDNKLVRVNLRPYKAAGGKEEPILAAFVHGAQAFHPDRTSFVMSWHKFRGIVAKQPLAHITVQDWDAYDKKMGPTYPYGDHSEAYEMAYQPSYRVLRLQDWLKIDPLRSKHRRSAKG